MSTAPSGMKPPAGMGLRKAAILLITLGEDNSAAILRELSSEEIEAVIQEVAQLGTVTAEERQEVTSKFLDGIVSGEVSPLGGFSAAEKLLAKALDPEKAGRHMAALRERLAAEAEGGTPSQSVDAQQLARVLAQEHPQAIAVYLTRLDSEQRAAVLAAFAAPLRAQVALRLASLQQVSQNMAQQVATAVEEKLRKVVVGSQESFSGRRAMADLCNQLPADVSKELLEQLEQHDAALAEEVRIQMFTFEDILKLDQTTMAEALQRGDRKVLTMALKGTSEEIKDHFMKQMSQRAKAMLLEDMAALGAVRVREVQDAQREIVALIREMEEEGVVSLRGGASESMVT